MSVYSQKTISELKIGKLQQTMCFYVSSGDLFSKKILWSPSGDQFEPSSSFFNFFYFIQSQVIS